MMANVNWNYRKKQNSGVLSLEYPDGSAIRVRGYDGEKIYNWLKWNFPSGAIPEATLTYMWGTTIANYVSKPPNQPNQSQTAITVPLPLLVRCPICWHEVPMTEREIDELPKDINKTVSMKCSYTCDVKVAQLRQKIKEARSK